MNSGFGSSGFGQRGGFGSRSSSGFGSNSNGFGNPTGGNSGGFSGNSSGFGSKPSEFGNNFGSSGFGARPSRFASQRGDRSSGFGNGSNSAFGNSDGTGFGQSREYPGPRKPREPSEEDSNRFGGQAVSKGFGGNWQGFGGGSTGFNNAASTGFGNSGGWGSGNTGLGGSLSGGFQSGGRAFGEWDEQRQQSGNGYRFCGQGGDFAKAREEQYLARAIEAQKIAAEQLSVELRRIEAQKELEIERMAILIEREFNNRRVGTVVSRLNGIESTLSSGIALDNGNREIESHAHLLRKDSEWDKSKIRPIGGWQLFVRDEYENVKNGLNEKSRPSVIRELSHIWKSDQDLRMLYTGMAERQRNVQKTVRTCANDANCPNKLSWQTHVRWSYVGTKIYCEQCARKL